MVRRRNQRLSIRLSRFVCLIPLFFVTFLAGCSGAPSLSALDPPDGRPHDVVLVKGAGRELAQIVWDAGAPGEKLIPGGFGGAFMFSVPPGATPGPHNVALQNNSGRSMPLTFNVPPSPGLLTIARPQGPTRAFPAPRIDAVTILEAVFDSSGVRVLLYVQGANVDVGATVWVQDASPLAEVATVSHKTMLNDWFGVSANEFDYPIYHYTSLIASPGVRKPGDTISIVVKNLDGMPSKAFEYRLPLNADTIDSDGDALLDKWETSGYDANMDGVIDVDLPALGANPYRRDLFLELDIMDGVDHRPDRDAMGAPDTTVFDGLKKMFASAPIINIGDAPGIHLVIDSSGKPCLAQPGGGDLCSFTTTMFDRGGNIPYRTEPDPFVTSIVRFSALKEHSFDNNRRGRIYHYGIWGIEQANGRPGQSDDRDDLVISFEGLGFPETYHRPRSQIEILAHELGHSLGQLHAGDADEPELKPNYLSVMSYSWVFRTGWSDDLRLQQTTCLPSYYAKAGAQEMSGSAPPNPGLVVDYSEGMARALVRPMPTATGATAFCDSAIDWSTMDAAFTKVKDFANWPGLVFDGLAKTGGIWP